MTRADLPAFDVRAMRDDPILASDPECMMAYAIEVNHQKRTVDVDGDTPVL